MTAGALIAASGMVACKKTRSAGGEVSRNWAPTKQDAYMGVPAAEVQSALGQRLASKPASVPDDQWKHVKKLYAAYPGQLLWLDGKGVQQPRVQALLNTIASADSDAVDLTRFPLNDLNHAVSSIGGNPTAQQLADADVMLSSAFVAYGETMFNGQLDPGDLGQAWHINNRDATVDSALALSLREDDFTAALVRMRPADAGYDSLRTELGKYREIVKNGGWPTIPEGKALKRGQRDAADRINALRTRLRAEGYFVGDSSGAPVFDRTLAAAIADYQARHSIAVDSMLGAETVESLNLPADYRVAQIAANLERYRWMPHELGDRYILVNVPQFYLHAYDSGQTALDMKVIVGKEYEDRATPVFADSMETVVFRPYWNVTPTIAAKEIFPKLAEDPGYLAANNMEIWNDQGKRAVRQVPGEKNSLGLVKFLFPNDFNIYLHDTPQHELFKKDVRAFSHGCIRLEKPAELAQWVLGWDAARVDAEMHGKNNHAVQLPKKIPVYIVYFTAFVQDGHLNFGNDLYDRDSKLVTQMKAATTTPETQAAQDSLRALAKS